MKSLTALTSGLVASFIRQLPVFVFLYIVFLLPVIYEWDSVFNLRWFILFVLPQPFVYSIVLSLLSDSCKALKWIVVTFGVLVFWIELSAYLCQGSRFTSSVLIIILQTNPAEAMEFATSLSTLPKLLISAASALLCAACFCFIDRGYRHRRLVRLLGLKAKSRRVLSVVLVLAIIAGCMVSVKITSIILKRDYREYWQRIANAGCIIAPTSYYTAISDVRYESSLIDTDRLLMANEQIKVESIATDSLDIVFVIGESHIKHRTSTYGYFQPTYPHMDSLMNIGQLIPFTDVITYSNRTREVFPKLMSTFLIGEDFDRYSDAPLLAAIMKKAGYTVALYSNQSPIISADKFDFGCYYFLSDKRIVDNCFDYISYKTDDYDSDFIEYYPPLTTAANNFTIYHLMGQHDNADGRVPASWPRPFKPSQYLNLKQFNDNQPQSMADYDNACAYNDYVINRLVEQLSGRKAILFYVPDHGEEDYDWRDRHGRILNCFLYGTIKTVYEMPLFIWISPGLIKTRPELFAQLSANSDRPIYNTDISHTIIDVAGISTPALKRPYSLLDTESPRRDRHIGNLLQCGYDSIADGIRSTKLIYEAGSSR